MFDFLHRRRDTSNGQEGTETATWITAMAQSAVKGIARELQGPLLEEEAGSAHKRQSSPRRRNTRTASRARHLSFRFNHHGRQTRVTETLHWLRLEVVALWQHRERTGHQGFARASPLQSLRGQGFAQRVAASIDIAIPVFLGIVREATEAEHSTPSTLPVTPCPRLQSDRCDSHDGGQNGRWCDN